MRFSTWAEPTVHTYANGLSQLAGGDELRNNIVVKTDLQSPDLRTRDQVARAILEAGPSTANALAMRLKLTPAGIRRHLDYLIEDGILEEREPHSRSARTRGRPSKVFVMSDTGRERFEHSYDDLAVSALKYIAANSGEHLVTGFARHRAEEIVRHSKDRVSNSKSAITGLAEFLSEEGYAAILMNMELASNCVNTTVRLPMSLPNFQIGRASCRERVLPTV